MKPENPMARAMRLAHKVKEKRLRHKLASAIVELDLAWTQYKVRTLCGLINGDKQ